MGQKAFRSTTTCRGSFSSNSPTIFSSTPSLFLQKILREIRLRDYWNLVEFVVKAINCVNDSTVERTHSFCHEETGIYKKIIKVILKNLIITGSCSEII